MLWDTVLCKLFIFEDEFRGMGNDNFLHDLCFNYNSRNFHIDKQFNTIYLDVVEQKL